LEPFFPLSCLSGQSSALAIGLDEIRADEFYAMPILENKRVIHDKDLSRENTRFPALNGRDS
jgi:hypothetical protein